MANKHRGEVEIMLDRKRILKFGTYAVSEVEDAMYPLKIDEILSEERLGRTKTIIELLRACLKHEDETLEYKDVADMLDEADDTEVLEKIKLAFDCSTYVKKMEKQAENAKKKKKTQNGTGTS